MKEKAVGKCAGSERDPPAFRSRVFRPPLRVSSPKETENPKRGGEDPKAGRSGGFLRALSRRP
ncbi:hypothetical protein PLACP1_18790 [Planifilum fimeticola]